MPLKLRMLIIGGLFVVGAGAGLWVSQHQAPDSNPRLSLKKGGHQHLPSLQKPQSSFVVEIQQGRSRQFEGHTQLELASQVHRLAQVDQELSYRWILPEGVELVKGPLEGHFSPGSLDSPGSSLENSPSPIVVSYPSTSMNLTIILDVHYFNGESKIGASGVFQTQASKTKPIRPSAFNKLHL